MTPPYQVEEIVGQRPWESKQGGVFIDYTMALVGVPEQCILTQKPDTAAPKAGDTLELTLEDYPPERVERYAPLANMKKASKPKQFGGGFGGGPRPEDPKRSAAIQRMHSQEIAIQLVRLGLETASVKAPADSAALFELVKKTADWLDRDVQAVRDAA